MHPRIQLDESEDATLIHVDGAIEPAYAATRHLLDPDWEDASAEPLMLYVAEEPRVGLEFSYHGLDWQIVEYRDGWIAELVVD